MTTFAKANVLGLSVPERIQFVEDIWDTIAEVPDEVGLSTEQKAELDRRLEAYRLNPDEGSPWGKVRKPESFPRFPRIVPHMWYWIGAHAEYNRMTR